MSQDTTRIRRRDGVTQRYRTGAAKVVPKSSPGTPSAHQQREAHLAEFDRRSDAWPVALAGEQEDLVVQRGGSTVTHFGFRPPAAEVADSGPFAVPESVVSVQETSIPRPSSRTSSSADAGAWQADEDKSDAQMTVSTRQEGGFRRVRHSFPS